MSRGSIWRTLGIASTRDRAAIRRAYAARLKIVHPEDDAAGFQALRAAYEQALAMAAQAERYAQAEVDEDDWDEDDDGDDEAAPVVVSQPYSIVSPRGEREPAEPAEAADRPTVAVAVGREETQQLRRAMEALRLAVAQDDRAAAQTWLAAVLAAPAMDAVSVRGQVEQEIAQLILNGGMAAATLIDPASDAFGWTADRLGAGGELVARVQARRADMVLLSRFRSRVAVDEAGFRALTDPPVGWRLWRNRLTPGLPGEVRRVLELIYGRHGSLTRELDEAAVAWWSAYLNRPQVGPTAIWIMLAAPPMLGAILGGAGIFGPARGAAFGAGYLVVQAAVTLPVLIWVYGLARGREWWRETRAHAAPGWMKHGWSVLLLVNLIGAALLPAGPEWYWPAISAPLALAGFAWAVVVAEPDPIGPMDMVWNLPFLRIPARTTQWIPLGLGLIPLALFWTAIGDELGADGTARIMLPLIAAAAGFVAGHHGLESLWRYRVRAAAQRWILSGALLSVAAGPYLLWMTSPGARFVPLAAAAVAVAVLLERVVVLGLAGRALRDLVFRWGALPALFFAVTAEDEARHGNAGLLAGGLWLLGGVAVGLILAVRRARADARLAT